jgi:hypothetical protein
MSLGRAQRKNVKVIKRQVNFYEDTFEKAPFPQWKLKDK